MDRPEGECLAIVGVSGLYHSQGYRAMIGILQADVGLGASFPASVPLGRGSTYRAQDGFAGIIRRRCQRRAILVAVEE
jgi:hypothetical protein